MAEPVDKQGISAKIKVNCGGSLRAIPEEVDASALFCFDVDSACQNTSQLRIGEIACDFLLVCNFAGVLLVSLSSQRVLGRGLTGIVNCDSSRLGTEAFLKVREAAAQVKFCMAVFFDYAASVILVW